MPVASYVRECHAERWRRRAPCCSHRAQALVRHAERKRKNPSRATIGVDTETIDRHGAEALREPARRRDGGRRIRRRRAARCRRHGRDAAPDRRAEPHLRRNRLHGAALSARHRHAAVDGRARAVGRDLHRRSLRRAAVRRDVRHARRRARRGAQGAARRPLRPQRRRRRDPRDHEGSRATAPSRSSAESATTPSGGSASPPAARSRNDGAGRSRRRSISATASPPISSRAGAPPPTISIGRPYRGKLLWDVTDTVHAKLGVSWWKYTDWTGRDLTAAGLPEANRGVALYGGVTSYERESSRRALAGDNDLTRGCRRSALRRAAR